MHISKKIYIFFMFLFSLSFAVFCETDGETEFKNNNPKGAIPLLEAEIKSGKPSKDAYVFLGLSYYQLGDFAKSIEVFKAGMDSPETDKKLLAYNAGNSAYAAKDYALAEDFYSLALVANPNYKQAILNRANTRLMTDQLPESLEDYNNFVQLFPEEPQCEDIKKLILSITQEINRREENARFAAEQERKRALDLEEKIEGFDIPPAEQKNDTVIEEKVDESLDDVEYDEPSVDSTEETPEKSDVIEEKLIKDDAVKVLKEEKKPEVTVEEKINEDSPSVDDTVKVPEIPSLPEEKIEEENMAQKLLKEKVPPVKKVEEPVSPEEIEIN